MTGRRKMGVKGGATLLERSFLLSCHPTARSRGACCRLRTDPFWDGMTMSRKRLLVERRRNGKDEVDGVGVPVESFSAPADGDHMVASA